MAVDHPGRPRLEDVARAAGVSASTASRVLNGSPRKVAEEFRVRVLDAAERVGYTTNLAAQATARGHYPAIGLVVGDIRDQFFARVTSGVVAEAGRRGLVVNLLSTHGDDERERRLVHDLRRQRPQALILVRKTDDTARAGSSLMQELRSFEAEGGRVVVVGESPHPLTAVRPPDFDGARALAVRLVELGYRSFAAIVLEPRIRSTRDRLDGFRAGLSAAGIALPDSRVHPAPATTVAAGVAAAKAYLDSGDRAELIFAGEDVIGIGTIIGLERAGLRVPADIAVAGYGGRALDHLDQEGRGLTSVRSPLEEMGEASVRLATEPWPDDEALAEETAIEPEVQVRDTTPPLAGP
ncbi:LacI family DNA-binding transcriptional regulator [Microlunatus sp. GCM10028923]|uniref:LacI family DNA-binding transcriptional regulator n=1 Tax=Microlunatus sp. GCM10028923 TaxID=3273400 RepID=UPI00360C1EE0